MLGEDDGCLLGDEVGFDDGCLLGEDDGCSEGVALGLFVGLNVGATDGNFVGLSDVDCVIFMPPFQEKSDSPGSNVISSVRPLLGVVKKYCSLSTKLR